MPQGSQIPINLPRFPAKGGNILDWTVGILLPWLRKSRVIPGQNMAGTQTDSGFVLSANPTCYIGEVKMMAGTLISDDSRKWLLCDGTEYNSADYPRLYEVIGNAWGGTAPSTFKVPPSGVFAVNIGNSPNYARDNITYALGDTGGYNLHGATENNHPDHSVKIDLNHTHDVPMDSQTICVGPSTGGTCDIGSATVPVYTANLETGDPDNWGTGDQVPATGSPDADQGSASKSGNDLTLTLKHGGWTAKETNTGDFTADSDNRPTFAAFKWYIRALP